ncbi:MAG: hypothetical protein RE472_00550 [Thermoplasmatales archaeon]|nr:MAG: hypothetical protein RE472_00550 [Thermoplasmatales archaeon]
MSWTVLEWAEILTAIGTILLSIVTVSITLYQIRKSKKDKIENWKDSFLNSHYIGIDERIKEIQNQIIPNGDPSDWSEGSDFGFKRLYTNLNHWVLYENSLNILNNEKIEVSCLLDKGNPALQHITIGYPTLNKKINEINSLEKSYKDHVKDNLQSFIAFLNRECENEFVGWDLELGNHQSNENTPLSRFVGPDTRRDTPVLKKIYLNKLVKFFIESIIERAYDINAKKEPGVQVDSFNILLCVKKENQDEDRGRDSLVAETENYEVSDEELSKFRKIWTSIEGEKRKLEKLYEEKKSIMSKYQELRNEITSEILNKYQAGYRILGECDICNLTKRAREDEIRPYVEGCHKE